MLRQILRFLFEEFLRKLKMKIFLIFLGVSLILWFITKLSMNYTGVVSARVLYSQLAGDKLLLNRDDPEIPLLVSTNGYRMLGYLFTPPKVKVNASGATQIQGVNHYITTFEQFNALAQQLPGDVKLERIALDSLFLDLGVNKTKRIPVTSMLEVNFKKGFSLYSEIKLQPDSITVSGAENLIDSLQLLTTEEKQLQEISQDFEEPLRLDIPAIYGGLDFSATSVVAKGVVDRFTEKSVVVPISLKNVPEGKEVKLFPAEVTVRYNVAFQDLEAVNVSQFVIECDFASLNENQNLVATIVSSPEKARMPRIVNNDIDYLIKQ
ncbi:hypothetical protein ACFQ1M_06690 [Sungkyunkwania multivorans]|uniref:YbbR-like domain-containing protein n=1 Tax=Sungkyunkwania multivorans TaxID=1173618 RepID=A0ABW3CZ40_9FLAO